MPFADILAPVDPEAADARALQQPGGRGDRGGVPGVPAGVQCEPAAFRQPGQILDFAQRGRRRLFQQHGYAGIQCLAGDAMAGVGRGADGDRIDSAGHCLQQVTKVGEGGNPDPRVAPAGGDGCQAEGRICGDRGHMAVARDLAEADYGRAYGHAFLLPSAETNARARKATSVAARPGL